MKNQMLAIANVQWQSFENAYEPSIALKKGTLFPELFLPFWAEEC